MGKDVLQRCRGCRLGDDGSVALFDHYGFNGKDFLSFEVDNMIWRASSLQAKDTQRDWNQNRVKNQYTRFFLEIDCMETLKRFLEFREIDKNHTVSPQVFVSSKRQGDTQNCSLSCLVTGFSPGVIEVSLSRAGETEGQDMWSSGLRPNGDATSVTLSAEEECGDQRE
ncbi:HMR1 protein, partial [Atractosteus spatula]|nr:HMR1 protein [Atractosteus spatula]